ncbi:NAD(P)-dependent alcohol dehydrogenase [Streptomyces mangrovisoli]|uniref:Enoyl reductase (ER) domain-containing protein n=1 Tax=Streptomyces mangrovisoli TaxID=1428628 RepID=A0A1J4NUN6_9ACTN|nr:NAD(P)-dependent alcohol dehydrogenase [Streptomyces mangrovisoli]OIJ64949.1 hypothetical protein WN71_026025 [Streptomyces mangrovisoli]
MVRAAVLRSADGPFRIEEVKLGEPGPHEVLVRVVAAGMCHTDAMARMIFNGPAVVGHEGAGVVEAVGSAVTTLAPGDHVVLTFDSCGTCPVCARAMPYHCTAFEALNLGLGGHGRAPSATSDTGEQVGNRWFGQSSFAEYCISTERNTVKVDPTVPLELLAPLGCGVTTGAGSVLNVMRLRPGDRLAVFGAGAVGLAAVLAAKAAGAGEVVAVDPHENRRTLALELGADRALEPSEVAGLRGFDFSFDTTARASAMSAAVDALGRPGLCVLVGAGQESLTILPALMPGKTITYAYMGHANPPVFIPELIRLWQSGRFPFDALTKSFPLADINEAENASAIGTVIKPVLLMKEEADG